MVKVVCSTDMELFDQGKQPKFVHVPERFGPLGFAIWEPVVCLGDEGPVEMMNGDGVPGVAGQGAYNEAACVVDEMDDDHFEDLHREPGEMGWACRRSLRRSTSRKHSPDSG